MVEFVCDYCGCVFKTSPARSPFQHHFCSRECSKKYKSEKNNKITFKCERCGKKIELLPCHSKLRKFCSYSCASISQIRLKGIPAHNKGIPCSDEQKEKISKKLTGRFRGEESSNWKGGITELNNQIRTSTIYKKWRQKVFERDNYVCKRCNKRGGYLEVHHKIRFSEILSRENINTLIQSEFCNKLWDVDNGVVYCKKCHSEVDEYRRL